MVQIWCFIVINLVAALERTSLSKPAVLCAVTWPRYPELSSLYKLRYFRDSWGVYRLTPLPIFRHTHIMDQWGTQIQLRSGPDLRHVTHGHAVDPGQRSQPQELCGLRVSEVSGEKHGAQMAKSTAWYACTQWKRTGWNVQRLGFETKHRHTEVTLPKKCNRHEVGFDSTGEYSPAP